MGTGDGKEAPRRMRAVTLEEMAETFPEYMELAMDDDGGGEPEDGMPR